MIEGFFLGKAVRSMTIDDRGNSLSVTGEASAAWIDRADPALYAAKHEGRDRVLVSALPAAFV